MLRELELQTIQDEGLRHISGGFAKADLDEVDYDDGRIYIRLIFGIQSDCQDTVNTDELDIHINNFVECLPLDNQSKIEEVVANIN